MTYISEKALALVNFERGRLQQPPLKYPPAGEVFIVLCRVMEQHEAYKEEYSDFRQEVSDTVEGFFNKRWATATLRQQDWGALLRFIIPAPKPDPLVEVLVESHIEFGPDWGWEEQAEALRAALESRGWEIREKDA
jgi:hypothetical protein